jgi:hypothetical protein
MDKRDVVGLKVAFKEFMEKGFEDAVILSTRASWGGSSYSVELFPDGTYRVQWTQNFGNLYDSPGVILEVPQLNMEDDWNDDNPSRSFFDNCEEAMKDKFDQVVLDIECYGAERYGL